MAQRRYYYTDTITDFLERDTSFIIGVLVRNGEFADNAEVVNAWEKEIDVLRTVLDSYRGFGSIFFEYNIPRMGRRIDVVALIENVVFVLEFKAFSEGFTREAYVQAWDYALDLKNFHEGSANIPIIPIVVCTDAPDENCKLELIKYKDSVYKPLLSNERRLPECILNGIAEVSGVINIDALQWARSGYAPTPTIVEAAIALYRHHTVEDITKHDADLSETSKEIKRIIAKCEAENRKAICFVTGVPGAGKTLIGLQTAIDEHAVGRSAVYLSGNDPLVEVLQEALARDYVARKKEEYKEGKITEKPTKKQAQSEVKAFIQKVYLYRNAYLEGIQIVNGHIEPKPGYFNSHTDKAYVPVENVAIFDEAQRAWTKDELRRFLKENGRFEDFPYSEPAFLISCMDRRQDWGVVICLIGGGQEINKGEAGIREWIEALNQEQYRCWDVYISDRLQDREYADGKSLDLVDAKERLHVRPQLHLSVSMRSFRAEKVSQFVHQLLAMQRDEAHETLQTLTKYPIVLTRSLDKAKEWLRNHTRGSERCGILASSKAERLKAISINVRYQPNFIHWFLAPVDQDEIDIRSSNALEDTLTEFKVQGLEIDWACIAWDADLRIDPKKKTWDHYQLRSGSHWQRINKKINQEYQINAYRVLLTRARQGIVIVVPEGSIDEIPPDDTRNPQWYNGIYTYLKEIGIPEI